MSVSVSMHMYMLARTRACVDARVHDNRIDDCMRPSLRKILSHMNKYSKDARQARKLSNDALKRLSNHGATIRYINQRHKRL